MNYIVIRITENLIYPGDRLISKMGPNNNSQ